MHSAHFTRTARAEVVAAQDWYEGEAPGLGRRFREALDALTERISANPLQIPRCLQKHPPRWFARFPYLLFFVIEDDGLLVIACFHASRDPSHWQKRT